MIKLSRRSFVYSESANKAKTPRNHRGCKASMNSLSTDSAAPRLAARRPALTCSVGFEDNIMEKSKSATNACQCKRGQEDRGGGDRGAKMLTELELLEARVPRFGTNDVLHKELKLFSQIKV